MTVMQSERTFSVDERIDCLRERKMAATADKQAIVGSMDHDDWGMILPPVDQRKVVQAMSTSGMPITDVLIDGFDIQPNHPSGGFFGPKCVGENFSALMEAHPTYVDPMGSLAGAYMVNFSSYRSVPYPDELAPTELEPRLEKYDLVAPIYGQQHFCQDMQIGLDLGFGGLLDRVRHYRGVNGLASADFYDGLEATLLGTQNWIRRTADAAREMGDAEANAQLRQNLIEIAEMNDWLASGAPRTFREACQWILWYLIIARMYNGSGSGGRLDVLLTPYYEREKAAGTLTDDEAIMHIANVLLRDTTYLQLGGPDENGNDVTNHLSYLILEAAHKLRIPANVGVCVGENVDPGLLRRGIEIQFEDKAGMPKFLGIDGLIEGYQKLGYSQKLAYSRAYSGCHWFALPGREYTLNDGAKINFGAVLEVSFKEMMSEPGVEPSVTWLWDRFLSNLNEAVRTMADVFDFHVENKHKVFPELVLDLCCYGPVEKGLDASHYGVEYYNFGVDGAALAVVADSFAAMEQRIEREGRMSWCELAAHLENDWAGTDGERARLMMHSVPRYASGDSLADDYAVRITKAFGDMVACEPTPNGFKMIPGLFSWANTIPMGKKLGATPNGRHAAAPISHGANPEPGFRQDGAPSAMAKAIASVQCGYGNSSPMQMELDPGIVRDQEGIDNVVDLLATHMRLGGTQVNLNIMDANKVLEAHQDPSKHPELVVRVTGFSAYFASLSQEFRQLVVDRIMEEA